MCVCAHVGNILCVYSAGLSGSLPSEVRHENGLSQQHSPQHKGVSNAEGRDLSQVLPLSYLNFVYDKDFFEEALSSVLV